MGTFVCVAGISSIAGAQTAPLLILYPSWWPAGVRVDIVPRTPPSGDTLSGRATALVADGTRTPPVSRIRVWRKPCED